MDHRRICTKEYSICGISTWESWLGIELCLRPDVRVKNCGDNGSGSPGSQVLKVQVPDDRQLMHITWS